jgi:NADH-quinone oxidoreductase subunit F
METDPHQLIEGAIIAAYATQAQIAYVYMRVEFHEQFHIVQKAIDEAYAAGYLGKNIFGSEYSVEMYVHRGAGAYVCGEETGLIESLEGKRGWPRIKPPFPAIEGLFRLPTVVNNVETLCCVPHIIERGAAFTGIGSSAQGQNFCSGRSSGRGVTKRRDHQQRELIERPDMGGGMLTRKSQFSVSLDGIHGRRAGHEDDFEEPRKYGLLGLGPPRVVIDAATDMRIVLRNVARFYGTNRAGNVRSAAKERPGCTRSPRGLR